MATKEETATETPDPTTSGASTGSEPTGADRSDVSPEDLQDELEAAALDSEPAPGDGSGEDGDGTARPEVGHVDELTEEELRRQIRTVVKQTDAGFMLFYGPDAVHTEEELEILVDSWVPVAQEWGMIVLNRWIQLGLAVLVTGAVELQRWRRVSQLYADDEDAQDSSPEATDRDGPRDAPVGAGPEPSMPGPKRPGGGAGPKPSLSG